MSSVVITADGFSFSGKSLSLNARREMRSARSASASSAINWAINSSACECSIAYTERLLIRYEIKRTFPTCFANVHAHWQIKYALVETGACKCVQISHTTNRIGQKQQLLWLMVSAIPLRESFVAKYHPHYIPLMACLVCSTSASATSIIRAACSRPHPHGSLVSGHMTALSTGVAQSSACVSAGKGT